MKTSLPTLFGMLTVLMFFNPGMRFEIFPYWLILIFSRRFDKAIKPSILIILYFFILAVISKLITYSWSLTLLIDTLQILSIVIAISYYNKLEQEKKKVVISIFKKFIGINLIVMILQKLLPPFQWLSSAFFSGRGSDLVISALLRNSAVTGLSPEPSYGSALICGLYFLTIIYEKKISKYVLVPVVISLILFKSVYGFLLFGLITFFYEFWRANIKNLILIGLFLSSILTIFILPYIELGRIEIFFTTLFENKSILKAEKMVSPDSTRLDFLNSLFRSTSEYGKSISFNVYFLQLFPFLTTMTMLYFIVKSKAQSKILTISILGMSVFLTPMLVWPTLAGFYHLLTKKY